MTGVQTCALPIFDHIIPWSKGGQTVLENAQLVHSTCNKYKQDRINFTIKGE